MCEIFLVEVRSRLAMGCVVDVLRGEVGFYRALAVKMALLADR